MGFIITSTSTCCLHHPLKEVHLYSLKAFFFFLKEMTLYQFSHGELLLFSGFYELMMDNRTISGQTINAVERLSLYPEVITSFIYRYTNSQVGGSFSLGHISTDTLNYFLVSF